MEQKTLDRYKKKVADQAKRIMELEKRLALHRGGAAELGRVADAWGILLAQRCGEKAGRVFELLVEKKAVR